MEILLREAFQNYNSSSIDSLLNFLSGKNSVLKKFGSALNNQEFITAKEYLQELTNNFEGEEDFVHLQHINIRRLEEKTEFVLQDTELNFIETLADNKSSISAYAQTMLFLLFEDMPEDELEATDHFMIENRNQVNRVGEKDYRVYPNPVDSRLKISYNNCNHEGFTPLLVKIYSSNNELMLSQSIQKHEKLEAGIDLSVMPSGLYFVNITSISSEFTEVHKLIKL